MAKTSSSASSSLARHPRGFNALLTTLAFIGLCICETSHAQTAPEATPAPQAPARAEPKGEGDYQLPLRFDPSDNKLSIDNPQLKYLMADDTKIDLGGMILHSRAIGMRLSQISRDNIPVRFENRDRSGKLLTILSFYWPRALTTSGELTVEALNREVLWKKEIGADNVKAWRSSFEYATDEMKKAHGGGLWGDIDIDPAAYPFLMKVGVKFRMCLSQILSAKEKLRICSRPYEVQSKDGQITLRALRAKQKADAGLFIKGKKLDKTGLINFPGDRIIEITVVFEDYTTVAIASQPKDPQLLDVVESADGREIILTGSGSKPLGGRPRILARPITHFWAPTGIHQDLIWQIALPRQSPTLRIPGTFNIPFTLYFAGDRIPKETDRVYIRKTRSSGTYAQAPKVYGYIPSGGKVSSEEYSAHRIGPQHFEWSFAAPKKGEKNRARLLVQNNVNDATPWVAHYEMFRSYPYEISSRLTGILSSDFTFIIMGEISAAAWFESLVTSEDPLFSKQRWGVAAKYLKSLTSIQSSAATKVDDYSVINLDLRYNILSGIWHRDEIVGLSFGFQQTGMTGPQIGSHSVQYLGLGGYWARTMPRIVNDIFNLFPFMDYPKYVDMDFTLYPMSMTSGYRPGVTFNLNFHGRVFWTERLYGEAGFGIRQNSFSFETRNRPVSASLSAAYGTMGLGYRF